MQRLFSLCAMMLRHRRLFCFSIAGGAAACLLLALVLPSQFEASTTVTVPAALSSSAPVGQLQAVSRYTRLIEETILTRGMLNNLLAARYTPPGGQESVSFREALGVEGDSYEMREALRDRFNVTIRASAGMVEITAQAYEPHLAAALANELVAVFDEFLIAQQQKQWHEVRVFFEEQLHQARQKRRAMEDQLQRFFENNYRWRGAPRLVMEVQRLRRSHILQDSVYLRLYTGHLSAQMMEEGSFSGLQVVDEAVPPTSSASPSLPFFFLVGGIGGFFLALSMVGVQRIRARLSAQHSLS